MKKLMSISIFWGLCALCVTAYAAAPAGSSGAGALVEIGKVAPEVKVEMRYAGSDNFIGRPLYDCGRCFLRKGTAQKLAKAQAYLVPRGLSLKVWDCYRPLSVQKLFWNAVPDPRFVADPRTGSNHNRGNAVDVTLVDAEGKELEMPTGFDDFTPRAFRSEMNLPAEKIKNREILSDAMSRAGFRPLATEWWHFDDPEADSTLLNVPFSELCR